MTSEYLLSITNKNKAVFTVRPVWVTNGCRSADIAMLCSSLRMLQFCLGMDWLCRSTKQGWLSFVSARIRAGPNTCFSTASAAGAAAAAAAACFCCGCLRYCCCCCTICWSCSVFYFLFERSEFLIDTPHKKNLRVCPRPRVK